MDALRIPARVASCGTAFDGDRIYASITDHHHIPYKLTENGVIGVWDLAPVSAANGVVYAASMAKAATQNQMFALDAATGDILWQFMAGSSVNSGPAVVNGTVYWGSGYRRSGVEGSGNNRLYAFSIDGQ